MKTKIKRHSRSVLSVILAISLLISTMMVGLIATDAASSNDEPLGYSSAKIRIATSSSGMSSATEYSVTLSSNKGSYTLSGAAASTTYYFKIKSDNDVFGNASIGTNYNTSYKLGFITGGSISDSNSCCTFKTTTAGDYKIEFTLNGSSNSTVKVTKESSSGGECTTGKKYIVTGSKHLTNPSSSSDTWQNTWAGAGERNQFVYDSTLKCYKLTYTGVAANSSSSEKFRFRILDLTVHGDPNTNWDKDKGYDQCNITDQNSLAQVKEKGSDNTIQLSLSAKANITIYFDDSKLSAADPTQSISVIITPAVSTVTAATVTGGTITVNGASSASNIAYEGTVDLVATPAANYHFGSWTVNDYLIYDDVTSNETTATVKGTTTVSATFVADSFNISKSVSNCTVTAPNTAPHGTTVSVSATAASHYYVDGLYYKEQGDDETIHTIAGSSTPGSSTSLSGTFNMPTKNVTIYAYTHAQGNQTINYHVSGNGYVSVGEQYTTDTSKPYITRTIASGSTEFEGTKVLFCAIPQKNYRFVAWHSGSASGTVVSTDPNFVYTVGASGSIDYYAEFDNASTDMAAATGKIRLLMDSTTYGIWYYETGKNGQQANFSESYTYVVGSKTYYYIDLDSKYTNVIIKNKDNWNNQSRTFELTADKTYVLTWDGTGSGDGSTTGSSSARGTKYTSDTYPVHLNVTNPDLGTTYVRAYRDNNTTVTVHATVTDTDNNKVVYSNVKDSDSSSLSTTNSFTMPAGSATANVTYREKDYYRVNFSAGSGGSVTATAGGVAINSGTLVKEGTEVIFTAAPSTGYVVNGWTGEGSGSSTTRTISSLSADSKVKVFFSRDKGTKSTGTYFGYFFSSAAPNNSDDQANPDNFTVNDAYVKNGHTYGYIDTISSSDQSKYIYIAAFTAKATETEDKYKKMYYYGSSDDPWAMTDFGSYVNNIGRRTKSGWDKDAKYVCFKVTSDVKGVIIDIGEAKSNGDTTVVKNCYNIIPVFNKDASKVSVYAKDGTYRGDDSSEKLYDYFPAKANTVINLTTGVSGQTDHTYCITNSSDGIMSTAVAEKGSTISVTTTIASGTNNRDKFYVKGFSFNGVTPELLSVDNNGTGVYTSTYKIPEDFDDDYLEITPIYYFKSGLSGVSTVEFYIENYDEAFQNTGWGNQLAVYPYYSTSKGDVNRKDNAYGGYPGQPVINYGGRRFVQVATTYKIETNTERDSSTYAVSDTATIKGITLSNYYYDRVHRDYCQEVDNHLQTYDYDDFYKIYRETTDNQEVNDREGTADQITFAFKYRTSYDNFGSTRYSASGTIPATINKDDFTNGWDEYLDYHDRPIDIFGKQLSTEDMEKEPLLVVSNGYEYTHAGYYATTWTVYHKSGSSYAKIGTITPSALEIATKARMINNSIYPDSAGRGSGYPTMMQLDDANSQNVYQALKDNYTDTPVLITYEKALSNASGDYHNSWSEVSTRSDGRWYYSYEGEKINASLRIEYSDDGGSTYSTDAYKTGTNTGTVTNSTVHFTNTAGDSDGGYALSDYHDTKDSGIEIYSNKNHFYKFEASAGSGYVFAGWWFERDGIMTNVNDDLTQLDGKSQMTSNAVFVARFIKNPTGTLNINHTLASTSIQDGTTYISVKAVNKSDPTDFVWLTNPSGDHFVENAYAIDDPDYMAYKSGYKFEITLKTVTDNAKILFDRFSSGDEDSDKFFSTADQATAGNVTTTSFEVDVDDLFTKDENNFPVQSIDTLNYFSALKTGDIKYSFTYSYQSRLYGIQTYTSQGDISEAMFRQNFKFDNNVLKFQSDAKLREFLASRAPYEDNYKQTITWNFDSYSTSSTTYNSSTGVISTSSNIAAQTPVDDRVVNISFEFPFDYTSSNQKTENETTTTYAYDVSVTANTTTDEEYKDEEQQLISFVEYKEITQDTLTYRPVIQADGVTAYDKSRQGKMEYLDWVSLNTRHHAQKDGESRADADPAFITAPDKVVQVTGETGSKEFTVLEFQYWKMMDKNHNEYKRCYSKEFNMAIYQTSIIQPVYSATSLTTGRTTDASASLSFLEYSRNQWNNGGGNAQGLADANASNYWLNFGDRVFVDFVISLELKKQKLQDIDAPYRAGLLIETVGNLDQSSGHKETDNTYYQNQYNNLTENEKTTIKNSAVTALAGNTSHASSSGNYLFSYFNLNKLDNKNSIEYYYAFANVSMSQANENSNNITPTVRRDKVYRAFSFIIDESGAATVSEPVYFTIYDVATVADGNTL